MRDGISMRTIRRYRLDDPRITDGVRAILVEAAKERQSKALFRRPHDQRAEERLDTLIRLGPVTNAAFTHTDTECPERCSRAAEVPDPTALKAVIDSIRRKVCDYFYLREMRDPDLTLRTNRRAYVLPRQIAMYLVRQLTGASLEEIGREFGGRHHSTVLLAINRIEAMRRADEALNRTITRLVDAIAVRSSTHF